MSVYAFIMAGGVGSRLWPRSRNATPKQFLDLLSDKTMLQEAYARLQPLIAADRILVGTGARYVPTVRAQLPDLPAENIIVEPAGRGTAPAIGLGALHIQRRDPEATMAVVTADHHIGLVDRFQRLLGAAAQAAQAGRLVTLGITPSFPSTGYGYIRRGAELATVNGFTVYAAEGFTEKPNASLADEFVNSGLYSWNSGMFIWQVGAIMVEFERQMPRFHGQLNEIRLAMGTPDAQTTLERVWQMVEKQTIDYGVMENARDVAVIPAQIGWNDIGSWHTLMELLTADNDGNVATGEHIAIDTHHTMVYSPQKLVATIGLDDLIVVETDDALLICPRERCQEVRAVIERLRAQGRDDLL